MSMFYIILTGVYILLSVGGLVIFKLGSQRGLSFGLKNGNFNMDINILAILGLACYVVSFLMYMFLISKLDLGYIAPITTGLAYILTFISAGLVFKEAITINHWIGAGLILSGVILINIKK